LPAARREKADHERRREMADTDAPWTQSNKELTLLVPTEADVRAKEVQVTLTSQVSLRLSVDHHCCA